jgi:hypothetical protein
MFRAIKAIQFSILAVAVAAGAGCATGAGGHARGRDVHASTRLAGDAARVVVSGPAWLLHVDVEGRDDLALYSVARKDGTDADCAAGPTGARKRLQPGAPNLVNLTVPAGEAICIAPAPNARTVSVMWHARRIEAGDGRPNAPGQALAYDGPGR